jgi:ABC-type branched-subunit amino acid transport system ATPase component
MNVMGQTVLEVTGLHVQLGGVSVLNGVDLALEEGRLTAFVGPNGAGKTTLFHAMSGALKPGSGEVRLRGKQVSGMAPWRLARLGLSRMFQDVRVFEALSAIENVVVALQQRDRRRRRGGAVLASLVSARHHRDEAMTHLQRVAVAGDLAAPAGALSYGNQKLLALARLLAGDFDILLLDEPTAGVAPAIVERIGAILRQLLTRPHTTVALIEHDYEFVGAVADRVCVLREGRIVDAGDAATVLADARNKELLIGL